MNKTTTLLSFDTKVQPTASEIDFRGHYEGEATRRWFMGTCATSENYRGRLTV